MLIESENKEKNNKKLNKDLKVLYNNSYVQITSIVSLKNQVQYINNKMAEVNIRKKNEMEIKKRIGR